MFKNFRNEIQIGKFIFHFNFEIIFNKVFEICGYIVDDLKSKAFFCCTFMLKLISESCVW